MNNQFKATIDKMPSLLDQLQRQPFLKRDTLTSVPKQGIYVFYEERKPIYVGRSKRMRERIQEHGRPSSGHNSAPFAFNLARDMMKDNGTLTGRETRDETRVTSRICRILSGSEETGG